MYEIYFCTTRPSEAVQVYYYSRWKHQPLLWKPASVTKMRGAWQRGAMLAQANLPPKAARTNSDKEVGLIGRGWRGPPTSAGRPAVANTLARCVLVEKMRGERHTGAMLANASLPPKAAGTKQEQGGRLAGKTAGKPAISVIVGRGRRGPSIGAGRPAATNTLHLGGRTRRSRRSSESSLGATGKCKRHHLTGSGRMWMARKRLLMLLCGGHIVYRGRRRS